jgi:hypothetical protein
VTQSSSPSRNPAGELVGARTDLQRQRDQEFHAMAMRLLAESGDNWAMHALAVTKRNAVARVLYWHTLYQRILDVPGVICEFGVHWGASMATLINLRGMLEPFNSSRIITGFDTFSGFPDVAAQDGGAKAGDYATRAGYEATLEAILGYHESIAPFGERRKFELVKGDASETVPVWLERNPHAIIAMAIFDMDIYKPTRDVLQAVRPRLAKGSVLVFDELNCPFFPGETLAVAEVLGLGSLRLERHPLQPYCAWAVL